MGAISGRRAVDIASSIEGLILGGHEDDHLADTSFVPLNSITKLQPTCHYAHIRGLAKTLGPDLRVAGLSADAVTSRRVVDRQRLGTGWVSQLLQRLVLHLLEGVGHPALVADAGAAYALRRRALTDALAVRGISIAAGSGLNVWLPTPQEASFVQDALGKGLAIRPGENYRLTSAHGVRISTSCLEPTRAVAVAEVLASLCNAPGRIGSP